MSPRSIRRAAERKAAKEARKAAVSEAQLAANRANAQLSTGPASETGKKTSSLNAVKTGLTGRTVLLPSDDAEAYRGHIAAYETEYKPVGLRECELVQSLADTQWRLNRIPCLEAAIYALGRIALGGTVEDEHIELHTFLKYEKQLRNLQLQEARLLRRYQKETAELRALQKARKQDEAAVLSEPKTQTTQLASNFQIADHDLSTGNLEREPEASAPSVRTDHSPIGFEFSTADLGPQFTMLHTAEIAGAASLLEFQALETLVCV